MPPTVPLPPLPGLPAVRRPAAASAIPGEARPDGGGTSSATGRALQAVIVSAIGPDAAGSPGDAAAQAGAVTLYARLLDATSLETGARQLAAALAAGHGFDRTWIGVHEAGRTRLVGGFPVDLQGQAHGELAQRVLGAMDEALDQAQSLAWPPAGPASHPASGTNTALVTIAANAAAAAGVAATATSTASVAATAVTDATATATATDAILIEHEALQRQVGGAVACMPLGVGGEACAAVCVERRGDAPFSAAELLHLERSLVLAAPALRWMQSATEPWHRRLRRGLARQRAALRQPDRRGARRLLAVSALAFGFVALVPLADDVGGRARIEGAEQRVLAAPTDGFVRTANVRPGDRVKAGDVLVELLEADLRLERDRWSSQLAQHENAYASAMARSDRVAAANGMARVGEAQAQLALVDQQLVRGRVTAPFDALVIDGDLSQSIGAPVRQGDTLLTLATSGRHRVVVEVDEVDIARVRPGQGGRLRLSSLFWDSEPVVVERIAPLARAVDGRNVFEVEARLVTPRADLRPGLLGRANLDSDRAPLLWAWSRHALQRLRVAAWAWLG